MITMLYRFFTFLTQYFQNRCKKLEDELVYKKLEKHIKNDLSNVLTFFTPAGTIILCKSESCPDSIIDLFKDYDKLLTASTNSNNPFIVTNVNYNSIPTQTISASATIREAQPQKADLNWKFPSTSNPEK